MNSLLLDYKDDILNLFQNLYRKAITRSSQVGFEEILLQTLQTLNLSRSSNDEIKYLEDWFNKVQHHSFIESTLREDFYEIFFHDHQNYQRLDHQGKTAGRVPDISKEDFLMSLEVLALKHNISWNYKEPFTSFSVTLFGHHLRATLVHGSTSATGTTKLFLRKIQSDRPQLEKFYLSPDQLALIQSLVSEKKNVLISGSTGSGKTTFLRSLLQEIPEAEHLIVLEDTYEIMNRHPGQTSFLAIKDQPGKTLKDYCAYALRMSPDRMIVGEMRSSEVVPFLLAMNTGHKGLMSTIHASSGVDALNRIALLFSLFSESADLSYALVLKLVCKNIDYVVHLEDKRVKEICKVIGSEGETPFYEQLY